MYRDNKVPAQRAGRAEVYSYCRRDGWLCAPGRRCDEHRVDVDAEHWADILWRHIAAGGR